MAEGTAPAIESPGWWLARLLKQLRARHTDMQLWDSYYRGKQPLAFASDKFREAFGDRFPAFTSNFCSLVVDGTSERLEVSGFRFGAPENDAKVWEIWQANELDAHSQLAHTEALIKGASYALVEPAVAGGIPTITIEDGLEAIVERNPRRPTERRAGLKAWVDDEGHVLAYVYLPDAIAKYRSRRPMGDRPLMAWPDQDWLTWSVDNFEPWQPQGEDWPLRNALGVVPLVELPNRPRLGRYGQSEVEPIRSNQDAVNKYRCDALIASEFAAFPQRYLLNYETATDPETGRAKEPFRAAIDRLWTVPPPDPDEEGNAGPTPVMGQFAAASLEPYERMITLEVGHISSISRMPYTALLGNPQSVPASAESTKASEAGLIRKLGRSELFLGQGWEAVIRVALLAMESNLAKVPVAETRWVDEETRNEAVRTDAVVKLHQEGIIDDEVAWEMAGLTRAQIDHMRAAKVAAEEAGAEAAPPPNPPGPTLVPAPTGPRMSATAGR